MELTSLVALASLALPMLPLNRVQHARSDQAAVPTGGLGLPARTSFVPW
jgi:hypothetical protein